MEDQWQNIKNSIHNIFEKVLRYRKKKFRKEWMTSEILDMKERRFTKGNIQKYIIIYTETYIARKSRKKYMAGKANVEKPKNCMQSMSSTSIRS